MLTSEDVIERADANGAGDGIGLRGGSFLAEATSTGYRLKLHDIRWTEDLSVSGLIDWPGRSGVVKASLELRDARGSTGKLDLQWSEGASGAVATALGKSGSREIVADAPLP